MDLTEILTVALATLIVLVVCHFAVFWVVRTLYPPSPVPISIPVPAPAPVLEQVRPAPVPEQTFAHPSSEQQSHVTLPTYEETLRMEGNDAQRAVPSNAPAAQGPPAARDPRLDTVDPRSGVPTGGAV